MQAATDAPHDTRPPGEIVRSARKDAGLTREQLAVGAGVSMSTISRLEARSVLPNTNILVRIASTVGVPVADLLPAPPDPAREQP